MDLLIDYALRFVSVPYVWGGAHPVEGFDCSGYVQEVLRSVGCDPQGDQTSQALHDHFNRVGKPTDPQAGALVFFGRSDKRITHVAFMIDNHRMVEAGGGGSKTTSVDAAVRDEAFVRVRPLTNRRDLVAVIMPDYPDYARQRSLEY